jgi:hypothetical protein
VGLCKGADADAPEGTATQQSSIRAQAKGLAAKPPHNLYEWVKPAQANALETHNAYAA